MQKTVNMSFKIKKGWLITLSLIGLLAFLNPTYEDFYRYKAGDECYEQKREWYFLIFSIYKCRHFRYLGFARNFIYIGDTR